jgi:hypothetical protein
MGPDDVEFSRVFQKEWWGWSLRHPAMLVTLWPISGGSYQVNYDRWVHVSGVSLHEAKRVALALVATRTG